MRLSMKKRTQALTLSSSRTNFAARTTILSSISIGTSYINLGSFRKIELDPDRVVQADGLEDRSQLVKAVGRLCRTRKSRFSLANGPT